MKSFSAFSIILVTGFVLHTACSNSDFTGDSVRTPKARKPEPGLKQPTAGGGDTSGCNDPSAGCTGSGGQPTGGATSGLGVDNGGTAEIVPKKCDVSSIKFVGGSNSCPANYAAYAIDDASTTVLACCPLPATDILASTSPQSRTQCGDNEVAVGASGTALLCQSINTNRYTLGAQSPNCYLGSGASGGSGATRCGAPTATITAMTSLFGTDACVPQPFGSLVTKRNGKNCSDTAGRQLLLKSSGQPVSMFQE